MISNPAQFPRNPVIDMKPKPAKINRPPRRHGLSDRIVWMTVLFDAFFLILVMAILAFIYVGRLNTEREDKAVLLAQDSFAAIATFYEETAADALRLAGDEDVIAYLRYLQGGGDPVITDQLDPDFLTYSRFSTTLKAYWESSDSLYDFIFAASTVTCTGSGGGCFVGVDGVASEADWNITERPWYQQAALSTSLTVSDPYVDAVSGENGITFVIPVLRVHGPGLPRHRHLPFLLRDRPRPIRPVLRRRRQGFPPLPRKRPHPLCIGCGARGLRDGFRRRNRRPR